MSPNQCYHHYYNLTQYCLLEKRNPLFLGEKQVQNAVVKYGKMSVMERQISGEVNASLNMGLIMIKGMDMDQETNCMSNLFDNHSYTKVQFFLYFIFWVTSLGILLLKDLFSSLPVVSKP